jgi:hypothetical protein
VSTCSPRRNLDSLEGVARHRDRSSAADRTDDFDLTDGGGSDTFDGPTELPGPWTPPPDPDFMTGTIPAIDRADLDAGLQPGVEPSDSARSTIRFSREEMRDVFAARVQSQKLEPLAQRQAAAPRKKPLPAPDRPRKQALPAPAPTDPPPVEAAPALPPRSRPLPATHPMHVGDPGIRLVVTYRWQLHHVAVAFALGILTGVVAMVIAVLASH